MIGNRKLALEHARALGLKGALLFFRWGGGGGEGDTAFLVGEMRVEEVEL